MKRPEQALQIEVARFLDVALSPDAVWFHVPNGGKRTVVEASIFKAMGVKAGVPDIIITWLKDDRPACVAIESKAGRGNLTNSQYLMLECLKRCGWVAVTARSLVQVQDILISLGAPLRGQVTA